MTIDELKAVLCRENDGSDLDGTIISPRTFDTRIDIHRNSDIPEGTVGDTQMGYTYTAYEPYTNTDGLCMFYGDDISFKGFTTIEEVITFIGDELDEWMIFTEDEICPDDDPDWADNPKGE